MVDSIPWVLTTAESDATKWNDTIGEVRLVAAPVTGRASVGFAMTPIQGMSMTTSGRASVSAQLSVKQKLATAISGSGGFTGMVGYIEPLQMQVDAGASVAATILVGIAQSMDVAIVGTSEVQSNLNVKVKYRPTITQDVDSDPEHPILSPRAVDGKNRKFFTPISTGLTNTTDPWSRSTWPGATPETQVGD